MQQYTLVGFNKKQCNRFIHQLSQILNLIKGLLHPTSETFFECTFRTSEATFLQTSSSYCQTFWEEI